MTKASAGHSAIQPQFVQCDNSATDPSLPTWYQTQATSKEKEEVVCDKFILMMDPIPYK